METKDSYSPVRDTMIHLCSENLVIGSRETLSDILLTILDWSPFDDL